jgi:DNA-binding transcriptional MocR family regulator
VTTHYRPTGHDVESLVSDIEIAVRNGKLSGGERLPAIRELATSLGISPTTVSTAYRTLQLRGVVQGDGRRGTVVNATPRPRDLPEPELPENTRDLSHGNPDPELLPDLHPLLMTGAPSKSLLYGEPADHQVLIERCVAQFAADGLPTDTIAITGGALDGIERLLATHLRPGDKVAVEDPGYDPTHRLVAAMGLVAVPVTVDERGAVPGSLKQALQSGVRAVILTPRAQNPTGAAFDEERAATINTLLHKHHDVLTIEDDHAGPVSGADAYSACHGLDHWAVVRSFSKWIGPDIRVAAVAGSAPTISALSIRQSLGAGWVSTILQGTVAAAMGNKALLKNTARAAMHYTERRNWLLDALVSNGIKAFGSSGFNVWIPVQSEQLIVRALATAGWAVAGGERFRIRSAPAVRVTTATLNKADAMQLAQDIASAVRPPSMRRTWNA